jgi:hypothetical protein
MIIDIEDELFYKVVQIVKSRNTKVYEQLEQITPLDTIPRDTLQKARDTKTLRIKGNIKKAIIELLQAKRNPTKYQIHKSTNIAYVTLNKYYDDILDEVQNARDEH